MNTRASVVVAGLAFAALGQGVASAADPLRLTRPVHATKFDIAPARTYLTPYLAVDPKNKLRVAGAFIETRTKRCGFMRSTDGGTTWTRLESSPSPPSYPFCLMTNSHTFQGKVEWGRDGALYYALDGWDTQDAPRRSVFLARSEDFGDSWTPVAVDDARGTDGADQLDNRPLSSLTVDRKSGNQDAVYLAWRRQFPGQSTPNSKANAAMVSVSTDGGRTFSPPGRTSPSTPVRSSGARTSTGWAPRAASVSAWRRLAPCRARTPTLCTWGHPSARCRSHQ